MTESSKPITTHSRPSVFIGQAGWALSKQMADEFPSEGTHLQRYAAKLPAVEINSSFYRPHLAKTYERWAASVPNEFRFAVKVPKQITHESRLRDRARLKQFIEEIAPLEQKRGPLLVQMPPSFAFDEKIAGSFFESLRKLVDTEVVCEPRHVTWFQPSVDRLWDKFRITRVASDPTRGLPNAGEPGGQTDLAYFRLHGSPRMYYSNYDDTYLKTLSEMINRLQCQTIWCIFDNTALGFALVNALRLQELQMATTSSHLSLRKISR